MFPKLVTAAAQLLTTLRGARLSGPVVVQLTARDGERLERLIGAMARVTSHDAKASVTIADVEFVWPARNPAEKASPQQ